MKIIRAYLIALAYLGLGVPLFFYTGFASAYIFAEVTAVQSIVLASVLPLIVLWIYDPRSRPVPQRAFLMPAVFLSVLVLSALAGIDPLKSLFGVWERFGSVLDWFTICWYGLLLLSLLRTTEAWMRFFRLLSGIATVESLYALLQLSPWPVVFASGARIFGTLGNPAFLAGYLLLSIGVTLTLRMSVSQGRHLLYDASIVLQAIALVLTQTRSAIAGLILAALGCVMVILKQRRVMLRRTLQMFGVLVLLVALLSFGIEYGRGLDTIQLTQSVLAGQSSASRFLVWKEALQGFMDRPFLGFGENNFIFVFQRHFDPRLYHGQEDSTWFDKSHNEFLDRLALGGIAGFLAYLCMLLVVPFTLAKHSDAQGEERRPGYYIVAFMMGYAVYLFSFFHSIADTLIWMICYAYLFHLHSRPTQSPAAFRQNPKTVLGSFSVILSLALACIVLRGPVEASMAVRTGMRAATIDQAIPFYSKALADDSRAGRFIVPDLYARIAYRPDDPSRAGQHMVQLQQWAASLVKMYPFELQYQRPLVFAYRNRPDDPAYQSYALGLTGAGVLLAPSHPEPYMLRGVVLLDVADSAQDPQHRNDALAEARVNFAEAYRLAPNASDTTILYDATKVPADTSFGSLTSYIRNQSLFLKLSDWVLAIQLGAYYHNKSFVSFLKEELYKPEHMTDATLDPARSLVTSALASM